MLSTYNSTCIPLNTYPLLYSIGIAMIDGIGPISAKKLIAYCGGPEAVFYESKSALLKIPGIGSGTANAIVNQSILNDAEAEIEFIGKHDIQPLFYLEEGFPERLIHCEDGPILLYFKGNANFENPKTVSIVGTRNASSYGKQVCEKLVQDLKIHNPLVLSGLAYGIDICAHRAALANGLQTVAVLAHGLNRIYPGIHRKTAEEMLEMGGLLTEFRHTSKPDRENFPKRNRIVAGLSDAAVIIESGIKGGSMITADIANSYNREVFAVPGQVGSDYSKGCHYLIKNHKAALLEEIEDLEIAMAWSAKEEQPLERELFVDLNQDEEVLVNILKYKGEVSVDQLSIESKLPMNKTSTILLGLEFKGVVTAKPGKMYAL